MRVSLRKLQQCCREAYDIPQRLEKSNYLSRTFKIVRQYVFCDIELTFSSTALNVFFFSGKGVNI